MKKRELLGYFEEFLALDRYGGRPVGMGWRDYPVELPPEQAGRKLGYAGLREFDLVETVTLAKGHRLVRYKASPERPVRVSTMLQMTEGRELD